MQNHAPAVEVEIRRLQREIERLRREKPDGWEDLSGRYAAAIEGLRAEIDRALSKGR